MGRLEGKVAVVTGAGSGIGAATVKLFGREGAKVVVADINAEAGKSVEAEISSAGGSAKFVEVDVTKAEDVQRMFEVAERELGGVDVIHNNAAAILIGNVADLSEEDWDLSMRGGLRGYFLGTKYGIPYLKRRGGGAIINTASVAGFTANHGLATHNVCKTAILGLTRSTAVDYAQDNIRANAVCPGGTLSPPMRMLLSRPDTSESVKSVPMGRAAEPIEQAYAALFLASDAAAYVTGVALAVDGGLLAFSGDPIHWDRLFFGNQA